jgi:hypothetical protein
MLSLDPCWIKALGLVFWASVQIEFVAQVAVRTNRVVGEWGGR